MLTAAQPQNKERTMTTSIDVDDATIELLTAHGWMRHVSVDLTDEELADLDQHGHCERDGQAIQMVGQTDLDGDTYAYAAEDEDGDLLIAPYTARAIDADPGDGQRSQAIEALANAVFARVPDQYVQSVAVRL